MAKFKIWMVALTLIMGVSLSSCFDSDNDTNEYGARIAKVNSIYGMSYYFETLDGLTITPTASSIAALENNGFKFSEVDGKMVYITYQWDTAVLEIPNNATKIEGVTLSGIASLDSPVEIVYERGAENDSISDTPIITMKYDNTEVKPYFFDRSTLVLPINYFIQSYSHSFTLVYYPNEETVDGNVKLYLRHKKGRDNMTSSSPTSWDQLLYYNLPHIFWRSFDLRSLQGYVSLDKVIVEADENNFSVDLKDNNTKTNQYTVEFKTN